MRSFEKVSDVRQKAPPRELMSSTSYIYVYCCMFHSKNCKEYFMVVLVLMMHLKRNRDSHVNNILFPLDNSNMFCIDVNKCVSMYLCHCDCDCFKVYGALISVDSVMLGRSLMIG